MVEGGCVVRTPQWAKASTHDRAERDADASAAVGGERDPCDAGPVARPLRTAQLWRSDTDGFLYCAACGVRVGWIVALPAVPSHLVQQVSDELLARHGRDCNRRHESGGWQ
jgi:hypothetical protein